MDKLKYILIFIFSIFFTQTFAFSWDIEHFKTMDWKHMCNMVWENHYKPCVLFWIKYKNDEVTFWQKPSLETWSGNNTLINNDLWEFCVFNWLEVEKTKCNNSQTQTSTWNELIQDNELSQTWNEVNPTTIDFATNEVDTQETKSWEDLSWTTASTVENNDSQVIDWMVKWLDNTAENDYLNNSDLWVYSLVIFIWGIFLIILNFICYLVNLIHAIRNPIPNKLLWIVLLLIVWITYILYYFIVKRPFDKAKKLEKNNNISSQNIWVNIQSQTPEVKPQNTSWFPNQAVSQPTVKIGQSSPSVTPEPKKQEEKNDFEEFNFDLKL